MKAKFKNCFLIHSKYFPVLKGVSPLHSLFFCSPKITPRPQVFTVNSSIICRGLHFCDVTLTLLVQYDKVLSEFGQQHLGMVNYVCGFNQSEIGNILNELLIIILYWYLLLIVMLLNIFSYYIDIHISINCCRCWWLVFLMTYLTFRGWQKSLWAR